MWYLIVSIPGLCLLSFLIYPLQQTKLKKKIHRLLFLGPVKMELLEDKSEGMLGHYIVAMGSSFDVFASQWVGLQTL